MAEVADTTEGSRTRLGLREAIAAFGGGPGGSQHNRWLWHKLWKTSAPSMVLIGFLEWFGSISAIVSLVSLLLVVRTLDTGRPLEFRGFELFSLESTGGLWGFVAIVATIGIAGGLALIYAEQRAGKLAAKVISPLRSQLLAQVEDPKNADWKLRVDGRPEVHLHQVVVSDLRDVALAARMMLLILGPAATAVVAMTLMIGASWQLSLLAVPFGLLVAIPLRRRSDEAEELQRQLAVQRQEVRDLVVTPASPAEPSGGRWDEAIERAEESDGTLHQILNSPARVRALNQAALVACGAAALLVGRWFGIDVTMLILFVFCLRFLLGALQRISGRVMAIARHGEAIDRYLSFQRLVDDIAAAPRRSRVPTTRGVQATIDVADPLPSFEIPEIDLDAAEPSTEVVSILDRDLGGTIGESAAGGAGSAGASSAAEIHPVSTTVTPVEDDITVMADDTTTTMASAVEDPVVILVEEDPEVVFVEEAPGPNPDKTHEPDRAIADPPPTPPKAAARRPERFVGPVFDPARKAALSAQGDYGLIFGKARPYEVLEFPAVARLLIFTDQSLTSPDAVDRVVAALGDAWVSPDDLPLSKVLGATYRHGEQPHLVDDSAVHILVVENLQIALRCRLDRLQLVICQAPAADQQEEEKKLVASLKRTTRKWAGVLGITDGELRFAVQPEDFVEAWTAEAGWL